VAVLLVGLAWLLLTPFLRLVVIPGAWVFPRYRALLVTLHMKAIVKSTAGLLRLGGARFLQEGVLPTSEPVLVVANHQSFFDIIQVSLLARPRVPAFVTRVRYARFVPHVSACVRLLKCPLVDPENNPRSALRAIRAAARAAPHGLLIFPEGHRSRDGEIGPFQTAGVAAMLSEGRGPVYLVVNDGMWRARRLTDTLFRVHEIRPWSVVVGPFSAPEDRARMGDFVAELRQVMISRLAEHRREATAGARNAALALPAVHGDGPESGGIG
jgi:1-acyl-sn-glycerol-3-phosphate acyltransferase